MSRFEVKVGNEFLSAIHIESMVASKEHEFIGKDLFNFCKEMLFESNDIASRGIIFAQCVDIAFWKVIVSRLVVIHRVALSHISCDPLVAASSF